MPFFLFPPLSGREASKLLCPLVTVRQVYKGPLKSGQHQCFLPSLPRLYTFPTVSFFLMHAQLTSSQLPQAHGRRLGSHRSSVEIIINPSFNSVNVSLVKGMTLTACSNHQHIFSWLHLYTLASCSILILHLA